MPGKAVCLGALVLGLACGLAASAAGQAQEVTVSGVVTSSVTGEPIAGASVYALGGSENYGAVMTDSAGQWTRQLAPGSYLLRVEASGYYLQFIGAVPADSSAPGEEQITAGGSNQFDAALVPNTGPYVGVSEATLSWSPATGSGLPGTQPSPQPFASMVYQFRYGAYAALPPTWPTDELFARLVDTSGSVVASDGVAAGESCPGPDRPRRGLASAASSFRQCHGCSTQAFLSWAPPDHCDGSESERSGQITACRRTLPLRQGTAEVQPAAIAAAGADEDRGGGAARRALPLRPTRAGVC